MYLMPVVVANFGRGETDKEFVNGVLRLIESIASTLPKKFRGDPTAAFRKAVIGLSELDEADKPQEHPLFRSTLRAEIGSFRSTGWWTMNPIVCGSALRMANSKVKPVKNSSVAHLSPSRQIVSAEVWNPPHSNLGSIGVINHHAAIKRPGTEQSVTNTRRAHLAQIRTFEKQGLPGVTMGDWNDPNYPLWKPLENAVHGGLDYIRYWNVEGGAKLEPVGSASFPIGIDPHKGHVCVFAVS